MNGVITWGGEGCDGEGVGDEGSHEGGDEWARGIGVAMQ
jgi:hypothetical protein